MSDHKIMQWVAEACPCSYELENGCCVSVSFHNEYSLYGSELRHCEMLQWPVLMVVASLPHLKHLDLRKARMNKLPEFRTRSLETLDLSCNNLQAVPDWVWEQENLHSLNLGANQLTEIPDDILHLRLSQLKLYKNRLTRLPRVSLRLRHLNVFLNRFDSIPEQIGELSMLQCLSVGNPEIKTSPSLARLPQLRWLTIACTQLGRLPEGLTALTELELLLAPKNQLHELPEDIGNLQALQRCSLYCNNLSRLPESFYTLPLHELSLARNKFSDLTRAQAIFGKRGFFAT